MHRCPDLLTEDKAMVELVVPVALFLTIAFATVGVAQVISDGRTRRRLLEANASPEMAAAIVSPPRSGAAQASTLKWGFLTGALGLALILVQFLPYDADEPIVSGILLVAASIGLLASYALDRRMSAAPGSRGATVLDERAVGVR
jgi:peptidoglycan/LPS O-acetylase OafA/YrhL